MLARSTEQRNSSPAMWRALTAPGSLANAFELMGAPMKFCRNREIYGEGEPADYVYMVVSGAVRITKLLSDGRRQIGAFHLPGDAFGLDPRGEHRFAAEAIEDTVVLIVKRTALENLAERDSQIARELWSITARDLQRAQDHMLLLGRKTAQERIAAFLLEMATRARSGNLVELPMSRQDIADYLGLTIETVSRTLTQLENSAAIGLATSRRIQLRDRAALNTLNA